MKTLTISSVILCFTILLNACFEKEQPIAPYNSSITGVLFTIQQSIYTNQLFYSFESNKIVGSIPNTAWDLKFESSPQGWHIRVNSSNFIEIYPTDTTNFQSNFTANKYKKISNIEWNFDKSNGNPDSTAVGNWVNTSTNPYIYTGMVYLVGQWSGTSSFPLKKMIFTMVNDTSYRFIYANLNGNDSTVVTIRKDTSCNYSYFSIAKGSQVIIEPKRFTWDILFSQYVASLPDNGVFVPYPVRGVLLNPNQVMVALDSVHSYTSISLQDISNFQFTSVSDFIGYNWKSVTINFAANTGTYSLRPNYTYLIQDVLGNYYKLKFLSFYNSQGLEGYPAFEIMKL